MAHKVQMEIAKTISPYCNSTSDVVEVLHGLAWNMVCLLNGAGMEQSDIMECVSKAVNRASLALAERNRRQQRKGKHTHGNE